MARLFPHSSLHWSPHFSHTHSLKCPLNYASFSPGAYFPASCLIIPLCPLGSCSDITPSGKIFTLDWIGHPASKLSSQYHNTDNDHFWSLLPSEDQRLLSSLCPSVPYYEPLLLLQSFLHVIYHCNQMVSSLCATVYFIFFYFPTQPNSVLCPWSTQEILYLLKEG